MRNIKPTESKTRKGGLGKKGYSDGQKNDIVQEKDMDKNKRIEPAKSKTRKGNLGKKMVYLDGLKARRAVQAKAMDFTKCKRLRSVNPF